MVTLFESKTTKKNKSLLKNLVALANADEKIAQSELACIFRIGEQRGLTKDQIRQIIKSKKREQMIVPQDINEKFEHIYDMVQVMLADGIVDDNEVEFCIDIAGKLGVRTATKGLLVTQITNSLLEGKKKSKILEEAKPFLA